MKIFLAAGGRTELESLSRDLLAARRLVIEPAVGLDAAQLDRLADPGEGFDALILAQPPDGADALDLVRALRRQGGRVPVILLERSKARLVEAYRAGIDDFLVRPVWPAELLCRLEAIARRRAGFAVSFAQIGELTVFLDGRPPQLAGAPIPLEPRLAATLACLARQAGRVVTREALHAALYAAERDVGPGTIKVHVCRLRRRLAAAGADPGLIETVADLGYRLRVAGPANLGRSPAA
jgi:two-component system cell cycle response regulator CtrA